MTREEAIEVYNGLINNKIKEAFEFFAPELAESEDERIRKGLIELIENWNYPQELFTTKRNIIAYLKKQKEQPQVADASKMEPEVELEKEIDKGIADYSFTKTIDLGGFKTTVLDYAKIARHFYELGLNARKEEKK